MRGLFVSIDSIQSSSLINQSILFIKERCKTHPIINSLNPQKIMAFMAGRIPRTFIDDLLSRVDIVEVIDARVPLKKKGKNYSACCPFHNEKTPSFTVSADKQLYHCFGCGAGGNAITFVMNFDNLEFVETIEDLAASQGLEVPREHSNSSTPHIPHEKKRDLHQLMGEIARFYQQNFHQPSAQQAISYLKNRGLSKEIVKKFGIGYIADDWRQLLNRFGGNEANEQALIATGMLIENDQSQRYDRFRGRIMFPIRDKRGRVVAFGGRVLNDGTPKYLNSPETVIYHKGQELYGLHEALQENREPEKLLVVEGYMDVVALAQFGIHYAVAALGTATTPEHIRILFRHTSTVICCYDGDNAGRKAAWRAMEQALPHLIDGRQLKFMFLPDGEDPDTIVREEGKDNFEHRLSKAQGLSDFLFSTLLDQVDASSAEGKTKLAALAMPLLNKLPDGALRLHLRKTLGDKLGILDEQRLEALIKSQNNSVKTKPSAEIKRTPMRVLISLLLQNPKFSVQVPNLDGLNNINLAGLSLFTEILDLCRQNPMISTAQLLEHWRDTEQEKMLSKLAHWTLLTDESNTLAVFSDALSNVIGQCIEQQITKLQTKERHIGLSADEKVELSLLLQR